MLENQDVFIEDNRREFQENIKKLKTEANEILNSYEEIKSSYFWSGCFIGWFIGLMIGFSAGIILF